MFSRLLVLLGVSGVSIGFLSGCGGGAQPLFAASRVHDAPQVQQAERRLVREEPTATLTRWRDTSYRLATSPSPERARELGKWEISGAFDAPVVHGKVVPNFQLIDPTGHALPDVAVGKEALVVVFFASWSELCSLKIESVRIADRRVPGTKLVFVSLDAGDTVAQVPGFMREHGLADAPVIDGLENPAFLASYNPTSSLPYVAVVGKSGELVLEQVGLRSGDGQRLENALRIALRD